MKIRPADVTMSRNRRFAMVLTGIVFGMVGLSFAAVPLYRLFCEVTGYGGTTKVAQATPVAIIDREVTVRFDANVAPDLPWKFVAPKPVKVRLGEERVVAYVGKNVGSEPFLGTATYNVTPYKAGPYFNKIQCFCFTEQLLLPGEKKQFTVRFFVDPKLAEDPNARDVSTITLSYTFFNKGTDARDSYMRKNNISYAPGSASGDAATASRAADGASARIATRPEGRRDATPAKARQ